MNAEREAFRIYVEWIEKFFMANSIAKQPGERYKDVNRPGKTKRVCYFSNGDWT